MKMVGPTMLPLRASLKLRSVFAKCSRVYDSHKDASLHEDALALHNAAQSRDE